MSIAARIPLNPRGLLRRAGLALLVVAASLWIAPGAFAHSHVGFGISIGVGNCWRCAYPAPPPVYYTPAYPAPAYYYPGPVYYTPPVYYGYDYGYYAPYHYRGYRGYYHRDDRDDHHDQGGHRGWQGGHGGHYYGGHR